MKPIESSSAAVSYYEKDDYYSTESGGDAENLASLADSSEGIGDGGRQPSLREEREALAALRRIHHAEVASGRNIGMPGSGARPEFADDGSGMGNGDAGTAAEGHSLLNRDERVNVGTTDHLDPASRRSPAGARPQIARNGNPAPANIGGRLTGRSQDGGDPAYGVWFGQGAAALGLKGNVRRDAFKSVLEGRLPNGVVLGTRDGGKLKHTPGWDLTFSAPKSISILIEVGGDERLLAAHEAATREAAAWLEKRALIARRRTPTGREYVHTSSMVAAMFTHHTSRAQEPNTHTHVVVANATELEDGKWRSVFSKKLFDYKMAAGNVYRAELAKRTRELGYHIVKTDPDGRFEVPQVPRELCERFSTRSKEIRELQEKWGANDAKSAARAAIITRQRKKNTDIEVLRKAWHEIASERDDDNGQDVVDLDHIVSNARQGGRTLPASSLPVWRALKHAVDRVSEPEAVFDNPELIRWGLAAAIGEHSVDEIEEAIVRFRNEGRLYHSPDDKQDTWTTPKALAQEQHVINSIVRGDKELTPISSEFAAEQRLQATTLTKPQRNVGKMILTTTNRFIGVIGRPGVGKSTLLGVVSEILEERGFKAIGMAQNAAAAGELAEKGIPSSTIHKHLARVGRDLAAYQKANSIRQWAIQSQYKDQVWFVDEATQIPSGLMRRITFAASRLGARVVLVGDPKQLPAIEAGKPFQLMIDHGMQHIVLDDILRQRSEVHKEAIHLAIQGEIRESLERLSGSVEQVKDRTARLGLMLQEYNELGPDRDNTLLLTARNKDKLALNDGVRAILKEEGKLEGEKNVEHHTKVFSRRADRKEASFYRIGDVVRFSADYPDLGVAEGDYRRIAAIDLRSNELTLEGANAEQSATWNPARLAAGSKRSMEIYRSRSTQLAAGEPIRWTRNVKELGLLNGQSLQVESVNENAMTVVTRNGEKVELNLAEDRARHWEHAYATTVYSSQGKTALNVIANADSAERRLFTQMAFLVSISRHVVNIKIFADNKKALVKGLLQNTGEKSSAVMMMAARRLMNDVLESGLSADGGEVRTPGPGMTPKAPESQSGDRTI